MDGRLDERREANFGSSVCSSLQGSNLHAPKAHFLEVGLSRRLAGGQRTQGVHIRLCYCATLVLEFSSTRRRILIRRSYTRLSILEPNYHKRNIRPNIQTCYGRI